MKQIPSPNFGNRDPNIGLDYIVVHYTGMKDAASAMARMCDPVANVSAHYVINEDGDVSQLVAEEKRAHHAGLSFWRGITDLNSASIGIELINPGHEFGYQTFPVLQISALKKLMREIVERHKMSATIAPLGHSDVAPTRKKDPGELFPWQELAKEGLGLWPVPKDYSPSTETQISSLLSLIGYDTRKFHDALLAFQRHYHPENLTGIANPETIARLRALKALVP